jgi:hypothetical protein
VRQFPYPEPDPELHQNVAATCLKNSIAKIKVEIFSESTSMRMVMKQWNNLLFHRDRQKFHRQKTK